MIGALLVVGLFVALAYRGLRAAFVVNRSVCAVPGLRADDGNFDSGVLQHERGVGAGSDEGDYAAVYFVGRDFDLYYAGWHGCAAQRYA